MNIKYSALLGAALILGFASLAQALPQTQTGTGEDGDASLTLRIWSESITGDVSNRCSAGVVVSGDERMFVPGDMVRVSLRENDIFFDDVLWQEVFEVTEEEISAQLVNRVFNCNASFGDDDGNAFEVYADVEVIKSECGFLCSYDHAYTASLEVSKVEDDDLEEDDTAFSASVLAEGLSEGRVLRDDDWYTLTTNDFTRLTVSIVHLRDFGPIDGVIFNDADERVAQSEDSSSSSSQLLIDDLPPGTYTLRLSPRIAEDFNFYDLEVLVEGLNAQCEPGAEEEMACGNCGTRSRICGDDRRWTPFGPCSAEGECAPGDERRNTCGNCGELTEVCSDTCAWEAEGDCQDEGECSRGDTESQECDGGNQVRTCDATCTWRDFSPCQGDECETGDVRNCYTGPDGTENVGVCSRGRQVCNLGQWGECEGEVHPSPENCDDARDNDCNGDTDLEDEACSPANAALGESCANSSECTDDLLCLGVEEYPQFVDGYCGDDDCSSKSDCGDDGVCAEAFGRRFCFKSCQADTECRRGYYCANLDGENGCVPLCTSDDQCETGFVCEGSSGRCVPEGDNPGNNDNPNNNDPGNNDNPNNNDPGNNGNPNDNDNPEPAPKEDDGCAVSSGSPTSAPGLMGLLALGLWWVRRKKERV